MLIYFNFLRKITTRIYFIIFTLLFCIISILFASKHNLYRDYDEAYKDLYFEMKVNQDIDSIIYRDKNIIDIKKDEDNNTITYIFRLKHYYNFDKYVGTFYNNLHSMNIKFTQKTIFNKICSYEIGNSLNKINISTIIGIILTIIMLVIISYNVIIDESKSNTIMRCLGYKKRTIQIINISKIVFLIIIPIIISIIPYIVITIYL